MRRTNYLQVIVVCMTLIAGQIVHGETWAERLGFPSEKRVLILHAHQMGLCRATNAAAEQLAESDLVFSSSVLAPSPWFANYANSRPGDVGLSLTLNSEWPDYRWQPVAPDNLVPSLLNSEGYLWKSSVQTMVSASAAEVEQELRHQILKARMAGLKPSHFTTHLGTLYTRLDLTEVYFKLAREYWIPAVVVELTPEHISRFQEKGFPLPPELMQLVAEYPLPKIDDLRFVSVADNYDQKKNEFVELIAGLKPGLTQISFAPAVQSEELQHIANDWQQRVWESKLLQDSDVRDKLANEEIVLTTWQEVMRRFAGQMPHLELNSAEADSLSKESHRRDQ